MAEYIEREAVEKFIMDGLNNSDVYERFGHDAIKIIAEVHYMRAADVAPVVRCKDCKWFANNNGGEWFGCWLFNAIRAVPEGSPTPDDFCSYGERKEGAE